MLKFSKLISSKSKKIVKDNNEYLRIFHLLKWTNRGPKSLKLLYSIMNLYQGKVNKVLQGFFRIFSEVSDYIPDLNKKNRSIFFFPTKVQAKQANGRNHACHMEVMDPLNTRLTSTNQSHEAFKCMSSLRNGHANFLGIVPIISNK